MSFSDLLYQFSNGKITNSDIKDFEDLENTVRERVRQLVELFATACGDSIQNISYPTIPCPSGLSMIGNLEIMTFHVQANDAAKRAFEYAYDKYIR